MLLIVVNKEALKREPSIHIGLPSQVLKPSQAMLPDGISTPSHGFLSEKKKSHSSL
jgi:hypothetical protein